MGELSFLLDTHALLWWLFDDSRLSKRAAGILRQPEHSVFVSSASAWEIATRHRLGKLRGVEPLVTDMSTWIKKAGFRELPITIAQAQRAGTWAVQHRDPFDRVLAAQSILDKLPLVSRDPAFEAFGIQTIW